jgi:hypothetical protein
VADALDLTSKTADIALDRSGSPFQVEKAGIVRPLVGNTAQRFTGPYVPPIGRGTRSSMPSIGARTTETRAFTTAPMLVTASPSLTSMYSETPISPTPPATFPNFDMTDARLSCHSRQPFIPNVSLQEGVPRER